MKRYQSTKLVSTAREGKFDLILKLLEEGYDVNERDEYGSTAIIYAVAAHNEEAIKILLDHGAHVNMCDNDGRSALFYSILWFCPISIVKLLIKRGANIKVRDRFGNTPLMLLFKAPYEDGEKQKLIQLLTPFNNAC